MSTISIYIDIDMPSPNLLATGVFFKTHSLKKF
jgi:hypothetical protein